MVHHAYGTNMNVFNTTRYTSPFKPAPTCDVAGARLLQKMGWRPGRGIGTKTATQQGEREGEEGEEEERQRRKRSKWGTVGGVSLDNTPIYVLEPKVGFSVCVCVCGCVFMCVIV